MESSDILPRSPVRLAKNSPNTFHLLLFLFVFDTKKSSLNIQTYWLIGVFTTRIFILIALIGDEDAVKRSLFLII